jgi:guanylate kinase
MRFSVSATTRPQRPGEVNGRDYFFLTREAFESKVSKGELVEWEEVFLNLYGTLRSEVERTLANGETMLFDVDVKGALSIRRAYPDRSVLIFVRPPSLDDLRKRLEQRRTEDEATIQRRLARANMEMNEAASFDHVVVNDVLERAIGQVRDIVRPFVVSST